MFLKKLPPPVKHWIVNWIIEKARNNQNQNQIDIRPQLEGEPYSTQMPQGHLLDGGNRNTFCIPK